METLRRWLMFFAFTMPFPRFDDIRDKLSTQCKPLQRSLQFWLRATDVYASYKICQFRVQFVKDGEKQEAMWEKQHEFAAEKIYSMCSELGGFFLKVAQILGKPDLAPAAWVRRLVTLCDRAPATPFEVVQLVLEKEFGRNLEEIFERFDRDPIGSASIAQICQFRVQFVKDGEKQEAMWEKQHEFAAEKIYSMCSELGGFFLKVAQILGKPDLAPAAWVRRLVTLCDRAPATPFEVVQLVLEKEFGRNLEEIFERFDRDPIGSASIAQVHRARVRGAKNDVAVKVQHPGVQDLMMIDIRNLQAFALYLQNTDIKFDLFSVSKEIEKQVGYEFDFLREAEAMEKIQHFLHANNRKVPALVPRVIRPMVTRRILVMEFIDGIPILSLGDEIAKRGINPGGRVAAVAKQNILKNLTLVYGQMILMSGFFHADPHPGNILICKDSEVALLDYGQVKHLPDNLRLGYANLTLAIARSDPLRASQSFKELGIQTLSISGDEQEELLRLAKTMFDTKFPPGVTVLSPFAEESSLKKISVQSFPEELFSVLRTVHLLRGLSAGLGINYSCAEQWQPIAEEALLAAGRLNDKDLSHRTAKKGFLKRIFWRK